MSRTKILCALAISAACLTGLPVSARAACKALTPRMLRLDLLGKAAIAFDDEGQVSAPLYLTLGAMADDGTFVGTLSTTLLPTPTILSRPAWAVTGAVAPTGPGALSITFIFETTRDVFTTYSGAIQVFPSCYMAMAGTYSTERVAGTVSKHTAGPMPFSGKMVRAPASSAAE